MSVHRCNGEVEVGSKALDDVLYRAQLELFPEPLLVSETPFFLFVCLFGANIIASYCSIGCSALCGSLYCSGTKTAVIPLDYLHAFPAAALSCNP